MHLLGFGCQPTAPRPVAVSRTSAISTVPRLFRWRSARRASHIPRHTPQCCANSKPVDGEDVGDTGLEAKTLRWREIPFADLQAELKAIEDLRAKEDLEDDDPWARFLRGAAYEHWGRPSLALAQYELLNTATGITTVPELWQRKAYNAFKVGDVERADTFLRQADLAGFDAVGNQMHFVTWFNEHFGELMPQHNGPNFHLQYAIIKYCMGDLKAARESAAPSVLMKLNTRNDLADCVLWLLAISAKLGDKIPKERRENDAQLARSGAEGISSDDLFTLLLPAFLGESTDLAKVETIAEKGTCGDAEGVRANVYLALYYDTVVQDAEKRDRWLNGFGESHSLPLTSDIVDFLHAVGRNKLSKPAATE